MTTRGKTVRNLLVLGATIATTGALAVPAGASSPSYFLFNCAGDAESPYVVTSPKDIPSSVQRCLFLNSQVAGVTPVR